MGLYEDIPADRRDKYELYAKLHVNNLARRVIRDVTRQELGQVLKQAHYLIHMDAKAYLASDDATRYLATDPLGQEIDSVTDASALSDPERELVEETEEFLAGRARLEAAADTYLHQKVNWANIHRAWTRKDVPPMPRELPDNPHHS